MGANSSPVKSNGGGSHRPIRVLVTGAGGFIGHHLTGFLKARGYWVRGVDLRRPEFVPSLADEYLLLDLRRWENCLRATESIDHVYALAADMGGMGFISRNHGTILRNNALIDLHTLDAARTNGISRYLYASSACVYPEHLQREAEISGLREDDAYPAAPQEAYGWEKLISEMACQYFRDEFGMVTRMGRFHNVYGPYGTWQGGREKAPAAMCRKVATAADGATIEIWGDGGQTRSFLYIDDCIDGIYRIMHSDYSEPLNLGSDRSVTIDELATIVMGIAGKNLPIRHVDGPQGVRGRNSDNTRVSEAIGWQPTTSLEQGLAETYRWIEDQVGVTQATVTE